MPGITLDGQRITGIKNSDIEKRAQSKGADLFLFEALSRPKHGTKELPEAEDRHQSVREILRVAIAPDVPFRIIRRELLAAQQAEHVVIQLRSKHCSDNIRMFIPFPSASNKRQEPRKIAIAEIDIMPNAWVLDAKTVKAYKMPPHVYPYPVSKEPSPEKEKRWKFPPSTKGRHQLVSRLEQAYKKENFQSIEVLTDLGEKWSAVENSFAPSIAGMG